MREFSQQALGHLLTQASPEVDETLIQHVER
jgi:hypothetical protein